LEFRGGTLAPALHNEGYGEASSMMKEEVMRTEQKSRRILVAAALVLALGFMVGGAQQASAKVIVRAKMGPVSVKVGGGGHGYYQSNHVGRSHRGCRTCSQTVVVRQQRPCRREAVWVPGHYKVTQCGYRKWVEGRWRLI